MDYYELLHKEFAKESDRACVIVAGAMLDELLRSLLLAYLVPTTTSDDPLFDTVNAPLATFSARIEIAFRCGIISQRFARDLHLVRKIRNDFAHNIQGCNFDDTRVRSRVLALSRSNSIIHRSPKQFPKGEDTPSRTHFLESVGWMIWYLDCKAEETVSIAPAETEWGYDYSHDEEEPKDHEEKA
jgi:DNA-binding MltR family transcriptional regulator